MCVESCTIIILALIIFCCMWCMFYKGLPDVLVTGCTPAFMLRIVFMTCIIVIIIIFLFVFGGLVAATYCGRVRAMNTVKLFF
jgi:hypothetical protein